MKRELSGVNVSKQLFLEKIAIFKIIHENKCEDRKTLASDKIRSLNESLTSLKHCMIKATNIRWLTYTE